MNNYQLVLGIKELSRPRGRGYLYYKIVSSQENAQKRNFLQRILHLINCFLSEDGKTGVGGRRSEVGRRQKSDVGGQRSERGGWISKRNR